uniref:Uncharacterized protein n=1 Tax=Molossus molossus TaxID=27622 RepID=A0A7J8FYZ2_MOLMO|nr:hypothetical protein HJG59_008158 [Molossus molossus]
MDLIPSGGHAGGGQLMFSLTDVSISLSLSLPLSLSKINQFKRSYLGQVISSLPSLVSLLKKKKKGSGWFGSAVRASARGLVPAKGTYLNCSLFLVPDGVVQEVATQRVSFTSMFLSLSLSLPLYLNKNGKMSSGEDTKKRILERKREGERETSM